MATVNITPPNKSTNQTQTGAQPQEQKKFTKVTTGKVSAKKKNEVQKLADIFIAEDIESVKRTVIYEMIIPAVRDLAVSVVSNTINLIFYGKDARYRQSNQPFVTNSQQAPVSFSRYWMQNSSQNVQQNPYSYAPASVQNITFASRADADQVLNLMNEAIMKYGKVSVADYYDLVGITCDYTDYNYGWYDIRTASIRFVNGGCTISLPKATAFR